MSNVTIVKKHNECCCGLCKHKGILYTKFKSGLWGDVCVEHWLQDIDPEQKAPFLGTNIGQILMTEEQVAFFPAHVMSPKDIQRVYGSDERYNMLIRGNRVVYTQNRQYLQIETDPPVLKCVFDIMTRLIPHESDEQDGGIKIWLKGKWS